MLGFMYVLGFVIHVYNFEAVSVDIVALVRDTKLAFTTKLPYLFEPRNERILL